MSGASYETLKRTSEFQRLFKKGKCHVTYAFVCYYAPNDAQMHRLGVVASKKIGNAVKRNRAKRVMREAFRLAVPCLSDKPHYDFVFVARGKTPETKSDKIRQMMLALFEKL